jgi:hypothetical protein
MPDSAWLPPGTVRRIRVLEGVPLSAAEWVAPPDGPASGAGAEPSAADGLPALAQRRFLGETEIQADGSLQLTVPANTPIELQTLDEHGLALRTCGWIWAKNVEARGCIGCHEDGELTPENRYVDALSRKSVALTLPPERRRTVDFRRDVMPIVEAKCVSCHGPDGAPPRLDGGLAPASAAGPWNRAYVNLLATHAPKSGGPAERLYVHPGRARTSPLVWHLIGKNTSRPWDGDYPQRPAKPIADGDWPGLTNLEWRILVEWVDLGALWDGIPGPDPLSSRPAAGAEVR